LICFRPSRTLTVTSIPLPVLFSIGESTVQLIRIHPSKPMKTSPASGLKPSGTSFEQTEKASSPGGGLLPLPLLSGMEKTGSDISKSPCSLPYILILARRSYFSEVFATSTITLRSYSPESMWIFFVTSESMPALRVIAYSTAVTVFSMTSPRTLSPSSFRISIYILYSET